MPLYAPGIARKELHLFIPMLMLAATLGACDGLDTSFVGAEPQYVAPNATHASSTVDWMGERIVVTNANGNVEVTGVPGALRIEVDAYPAALAKNQADGDAAMADVAAQIRVMKEGGVFVAGCPNARADHGSALTGGTGCARIVVRVPAGSVAKPLSLEVDAKFGGAKIEGITGSLSAIATYDLHASVSPTRDANVSVVNGNDGSTLKCPVVLIAPPAFETSGLLVESHVLGGNYQPIGRVVTDFPELVLTSCDTATLRDTLRAIYPGAGPFPCVSSPASHGRGSALAARIEVLAGLGDAYFVQNVSRAPAYTGGRCNE